MNSNNSKRWIGSRISTTFRQGGWSKPVWRRPPTNWI